MLLRRDATLTVLESFLTTGQTTRLFPMRVMGAGRRHASGVLAASTAGGLPVLVVVTGSLRSLLRAKVAVGGRLQEVEVPPRAALGRVGRGAKVGSLGAQAPPGEVGVSVAAALEAE